VIMMMNDMMKHLMREKIVAVNVCDRLFGICNEVVLEGIREKMYVENKKTKGLATLKLSLQARFQKKNFFLFIKMGYEF